MIFVGGLLEGFGVGAFGWIYVSYMGRMTSWGEGELFDRDGGVSLMYAGEQVNPVVAG